MTEFIAWAKVIAFSAIFVGVGISVIAMLFLG